MIPYYLLLLIGDEGLGLPFTGTPIPPAVPTISGAWRNVIEVDSTALARIEIR